MMTSALVLGLVAVLAGLWPYIQQFADVVLVVLLLVVLVWFLRIVARFISSRWN